MLIFSLRKSNKVCFTFCTLSLQYSVYYFFLLCQIQVAVIGKVCLWYVTRCFSPVSQHLLVTVCSCSAFYMMPATKMREIAQSLQLLSYCLYGAQQPLFSGPSMVLPCTRFGFGFLLYFKDIQVHH